MNISQGGMFVVGTPFIPKGTLVDVDVVLPGAHGPSLDFRSRIQVVWTRTGKESHSGPKGMGVKFKALDARGKKYLSAYIEELEQYQNNKKTLQAKGYFQHSGVTQPESISSSQGLEGDVCSNMRHVAESQPKIVDLCHLKTKTVLGNYRILNMLGTGGMGDVYLAEHCMLGRKVALKRLHAWCRKDKIALQRFFDEGRLVNQISHEHIVEITDFVCTQDETYYVMELLKGVTLSQERSNCGPFSVSRAISIGCQLGSALDAVHGAGIIHRDLKPENVVLIERNGNTDFVKLLDFGIAKLCQEEPGALRRTAANVVVGTPGYMAPEQFLGKDVDHRCDLYALGVLLYGMLTNQLPFSGKTSGELMIKQVTQHPKKPSRFTREILPPKLEKLILCCLDKEPSKRPPSARAVLCCLQSMLS